MRFTRISWALTILATALAFSSGCVSTKPGEVLEVSEKSRQGPVDTTYSVEVEYLEEERGIRLSSLQEYVYETQYTEKRQELKARTLPGPSCSLAGLLGVSFTLSDFLTYGKDAPTFFTYGSVAVIALACGVYLATTNDDDIPDAKYSPSGEYMYTEGKTGITKGDSEPMANETMIFELDDESKEYVTDRKGQVEIDLAKDFGLWAVEKPTDVPASVRLPERGHLQTISVDPLEWMVPHARVQSPTPLNSEPKPVEDPPQRVKEGEELRITERRDDWVQVRKSREKGWVRKGEVEEFWSVPARFDPNRIPSVRASVGFSEPSGNNRLDGGEAAQIRLTVKNEGEGPAFRVRAQASPESIPNLFYPQDINFGQVGAGDSKTKSFRVEATRDISSKKVNLTFRFEETNGFTPSPLRLQFETEEYRPPELTVADVGIDDASGNGVVEPGEVVEVTTRIRNSGRGDAEKVSAQIDFGEDVFAGPDTRQSFNLGRLPPGDFQDIRFSLVTNQQADSVPVTVDITEKYSEFGKEEVKLPLAFNRPTDQITEVQVEGQDTEVAVQSGDRLSVDIETNIPSTPLDRPDAIAVVIGIQNYASEGVPDVEYAQRDTRVMRQYLSQTLGFQEENILPLHSDGRTTYAEFRTLIRQKLPSYVKEGTSEVFVYYSGHGAPNTGEDSHAYLVPSDTDPNFVSDDNAYRLSQFYEDLAALEAESVTVLLDACFTGQAGSGEMMLRQASPLALSVENPLLGIEDATGFLASGPKQVANWYPQKKHGMFTYFFLKGLKGKADLNSDRKVTVREMKRYLTNEDSGVPYWSGRVHQRKQVPQVLSQDPDRVLVRYGEDPAAQDGK